MDVTGISGLKPTPTALDKQIATNGANAWLDRVRKGRLNDRNIK
jgi:hypothetical protein